MKKVKRATKRTGKPAAVASPDDRQRRLLTAAREVIDTWAWCESLPLATKDKDVLDAARCGVSSAIDDLQKAIKQFSAGTTGKE